MPVGKDYKVAEAKKGDFVVLEPDMYQVEISDVELEKDKINPYTGEMQDQFIFHFKVVDEDDRAAYVRVYATAKFFEDRKSGKSSKYASIVRAVYEHYDKARLESLNEVMVDDLIGKQIRVTVTKEVKDDGSARNKVTTFMPIKKELPGIKEGEKYAKAEPKE